MGEKIRGKEEYFILPENVLGILLSFGKFRDEGEFDLVGLLPCGYLEYITKVVNANRLLRAFAYPDMGEGELSKWKICRILERQLRELSCEDGRCFDVVKIRKFGAGRFRLYVKYGPAVHRE